MTYSDYTQTSYPSDSLMIKSGLWLELEAVIGFVVGLGLGSLLGQRTVSVIIMIVLEIVLTPIFPGADPPSVESAACGGGSGHSPPGARPAPGARRRRRGARGRSGESPFGTRVDDRVRLRGSRLGWWAGRSSVPGE